VRSTAAIGWIALIGLCMVLVNAAVAQAATRARLAIVLVSDLTALNGPPQRGPRGGYARLATIVKAERARGPTLVVHAGGALSPSLLAPLDGAQHAVTLLNQLKPDVFVPGVHDFDLGATVFRERMGEAGFPRLAANVRQPNGQRLEGFADTLMVEQGGIRIGVIGLTDDGLARDGRAGDLKLADPVRTGVAVARELRGQGADLVIAVVHGDRGVDRQLRDAGAIDIVLSGQDHQLSLDFDGRTALVQSRSNAEIVVAIDLDLELEVRDDRRKLAWWPRFRLIDTADVASDPAMAASVAQAQALLERRLDDPLVPTEIAIDTRAEAQRSRQTTLGSLVSDAIRVATGADVALVPGGMIGGYRELAAGTVLTRRDLYEFVSGDARTIVLEVTGETLLTALESGFAEVGTPAARYPQVSGLIATVDSRRPPGSRLVALTIGGEPLDPRKTYRLATLDAVGRGAEGYRMLRWSEPLVDETDGDLAFNQLAAYLSAVPAVTAPVRERIEVR
jgi:2',3'-cyclic-nucleotide 2'-phosphodiesterase (5'-nucleotidase family)